MADPFSYANDIAPIQQRFFGSVVGSRNLSAAQKNQMIGASIGNQLKFNESLMKLQDSQFDARDRGLRFESASLQLQRAKQEMENEKAIMNEMPMITQELESIINEPDEQVKQRRLSVFGVRNANKIESNPAVGRAFQAATFGVNRGTPARPSTTYGDLIERGASPESLELDDNTDINAAPPSRIAVKAIQDINKQRVDYALSKQKAGLDEKEAVNRQRTHQELSKSIAGWELTTPDDSIEFVGRQAATVFGTPDDVTELETISKGIKEEKDEKKRADLKQRLRDKTRNLVLNSDPLAPKKTTTTTVKDPADLF